MVCYNIVCYTFSMTPYSTSKPSPVTSAAVGAFASVSHGFYQLLKKSNICCVVLEDILRNNGTITHFNE